MTQEFRAGDRVRIVSRLDLSTPYLGGEIGTVVNRIYNDHVSVAVVFDQPWPRSRSNWHPNAAYVPVARLEIISRDENSVPVQQEPVIDPVPEDEIVGDKVKVGDWVKVLAIHPKTSSYQGMLDFFHKSRCEVAQITPPHIDLPEKERSAALLQLQARGWEYFRIRVYTPEDDPDYNEHQPFHIYTLAGAKLELLRRPRTILSLDRQGRAIDL